MCRTKDELSAVIFASISPTWNAIAPGIGCYRFALMLLLYCSYRDRIEQSYYLRAIPLQESRIALSSYLHATRFFPDLYRNISVSLLQAAPNPNLGAGGLLVFFCCVCEVNSPACHYRREDFIIHKIE